MKDETEKHEESVEWEDVEKTINEESFRSAKAGEYETRYQDGRTPQEAAGKESPTGPLPSGELGLAAMVGEMWNNIAVEKGYEAVTEKQMEFLKKGTEALENKLLKDRTELLPEIQAALVHGVVYVPKWLKHHRETKLSEPGTKV